MNARAQVDITHNLITMRIFFCVSGLAALGIFFLYFVMSRIGLENVGTFWSNTRPRGGNLAALALFFQIIFFSRYGIS